MGQNVYGQDLCVVALTYCLVVSEMGKHQAVRQTARRGLLVWDSVKGLSVSSKEDVSAPS